MNLYKKILLLITLTTQLQIHASEQALSQIDALEDDPYPQLNANNFPTLKKAFEKYCGRYDLQELLDTETARLRNAPTQDDNDNDSVNNYVWADQIIGIAENEVHRILKADLPSYTKFCRIFKYIIENNLTLSNELQDPIALFYYKMRGTPYDYPIDPTFNFFIENKFMHPILLHYIKFYNGEYIYHNCLKTADDDEDNLHYEVKTKVRAARDKFAYLSSFSIDNDIEQIHKPSNYFLELTIQKNNPEILQFLIGIGCFRANKDASNYLTHLAIEHDADKVFPFLLPTDPNLAAEIANSVERVNLACSHHSNDPTKQNCVERAIAKKSYTVLPLLFIAGANKDFVNQYHQTYAHQAEDLEAMTLLMEAGCKIDQADDHGTTPLHRAVRKNNIKKSNFLLQAGAHVNHTNELGHTALHYAAGQGSIEACKLLIAFGATINIRDTIDGATPLHYAAKHEAVDVIKLLIEHGADINIQDTHGMTAWSLSNLEKTRNAIKPKK